MTYRVRHNDNDFHSLTVLQVNQIRGLYVPGDERHAYTTVDIHVYNIDGEVTIPVFDKLFSRALRVKSYTVCFPPMDSFIIFYVEDDTLCPINTDVTSIVYKGVACEWRGMAVVCRAYRNTVVDMVQGDDELGWHALEA
jgi:hypothetical protein